MPRNKSDGRWAAQSTARRKSISGWRATPGNAGGPCEQLGRELAAIRKARGLSQVEGERAGNLAPNSNHLSKVEGGLAAPTEDLVASLLHGYAKELPLTAGGIDRIWDLFHRCRTGDSRVELQAPGHVPFVARPTERSKLTRALARRSNTLVTLRGIGGIGKTELALVFANRVARQFPGQVRWVSATGLTDQDQLLEQIGSSTHVTGNSMVDVGKRIRRLGQLLLVMDGFEGLVHLREEMAHLLVTAPQLQILMTSQFSLGIMGEVVIEVEGLGAPSADFAGSVTDLRRYGSARLFLDYAASLGSDPPTSKEIASVAQICRFLAGIPLALQLAATRFSFGRNPKEMLREIQTELDALGENLAGARDHQKSMRAAMNWTHMCLAEPEQIVYQRLAVLEGSFDRDMAAECCAFGETSKRQVLESLDALVERTSLVRVDRAANRYRMLDVMRLDALGRLSPKDRRQVEELRINHFLARYSKDFTIYKPLGTEEVLPFYLDIRASLELLLERGDDADAARIALGLIQFWTVTGRAVEGLRFTEVLLAIVEDPELLPRLLHMEGHFLYRVGRPREGVRRLDEALERLGTLPHEDWTERQRMITLSALGNTLHVLHETDRSMACLEEARGIAERRHAWDAMQRITSNIALHRGENGDFEWAEAELKRLREVRKDDPTGFAACSLNLSEILYAQGKVDEALSAATDARLGFDELGDVRGLSLALNMLALTRRAKAEESDRPDEHDEQMGDALIAALEGIRLAFRAGSDDESWLLVETLGELALALGKLDVAATLMSAARGWWSTDEHTTPTIAAAALIELEWTRLREQAGGTLIHEAEVRGLGLDLEGAVGFAQLHFEGGRPA